MNQELELEPVAVMLMHKLPAHPGPYLAVGACRGSSRQSRVALPWQGDDDGMGGLLAPIAVRGIPRLLERL